MILVTVAAVLAVCLPLSAATVLQLNLGQMVDRADRIFRGTVLDVREGTVQAGGGELPVVIYRLEVEEAFKGTFQEVKGLQIAEITMVGKLKAVDASTARFLSALPELPKLRVGQDYLLLTTAPSAVGLSTTVGLGQGAFTLSGKPGQELAVNGNNNLGLGLETTGFAPPPSEGPVPYSTLAEQIRGHLGN
jgi:hypothetical protein